MASWVKTTGSNIPEGSIRAGQEDNGKPLFIFRAKVEGILTPEKCEEHLKSASIPYGGKEWIFNEYEVLVLPISALGFYDWLRESKAKIRNKALQKDKDTYGGRVLYSGSLIPCKIATFPPHMFAYIGYKEKEHNTKEYKVASSVKKHFDADFIMHTLN